MEPSDYVDDGGSIRWQELTLGLIGSSITALMVGGTGIFLDTVSWILGQLEAYQRFILGMSDDQVSILVDGLDVATESWESFASNLGPAAFPVGAVLVALMLASIVGVFRYAQ